MFVLQEADGMIAAGYSVNDLAGLHGIADNGCLVSHLLKLCADWAHGQ